MQYDYPESYPRNMVRTPNYTVSFHKASGQYRKRIGGRDVYLGRDKNEAVKRLIAHIELGNANAGLYERGNIRIDNLAEMFARSCESEIAAGRLQRKTFKEYDRAIGFFVAHAGPATQVCELKPSHFADLRQQWSENYAPPTANRYILAVKRMFASSIENGVIKYPPLYGKAFRLVPKSADREHRAERKADTGGRVMRPDEIAAILAHADCVGLMRAAVLFALNTGAYAADVGDLLWRDIHREDGRVYVSRLRHKTKISQLATLWPETVDAIDAMRKPGASSHVFTRPDGQPVYDRDTDHDWLSKQFSDMTKRIDGWRKGIGFGCFRHTHTTSVGSHFDHMACALVRGHKLADEAVRGRYDDVSLDRIQTVTDLARERLYLCNVRTIDPSRTSATRPLSASTRRSG